MRLVVARLPSAVETGFLSCGAGLDWKGEQLRKALILAACLATAAIMAVGAHASTVDPAGFNCGVTVFTACNQTAHFSTPDPLGGAEVGSPSPNATNCPSFVRTDAVVITGSGQGIEHSIINNKGDGWFTSTFEGSVTLVPWTVDNAGNLVAPDASAPTLTGHLTQWFGGSFNNKNFVLHDTINFTGSSLSFHAVDHTSIAAAAGAAPVDFHIASC
jgi:hypothetical protein